MSLRGRVRRLVRKLILWSGILVLVGLCLYWIQANLATLAKKSAVTWAIYEHMAAHMGGHTYLGLFYTSFLGALFFVFIPLEAVFYYYLGLPRSQVGVLAAAWAGSVLGLFVDYLIGAAFGQRIVARLWPERFLKTKRATERWGTLIVAVSNLVPFLPVQFISLAVGATRFGARSFLLATAASRLLYLLALLLGGLYFSDTLRAIFH